MRSLSRVVAHRLLPHRSVLPLPRRLARSLATATATESPPTSELSPDPADLHPLRASSQIQLRDYQEESIQAVLNHVSEGHRRMGISLATGSGKTVIFTQLISRLVHPINPLATQTLILAHRTELVHQAYQHCRNTYPNANIEIEMGKSHASGVADITIASIASLMSSDRIAKFDPRLFKLILIDECHHAVARRYLQVLDHFGVLNLEEKTKPQKPVVVGVSATMSRFDGLALGKVMDHIVYHRDFIDMIKDKWLSPVIFTTVKTNIDLSRVKKQGSTGDFKVGELSEVVNTDRANEVTVRSWFEKASNRKSTIVFCVDIAHVTEMTNKFRHYGIDARYVTGTTNPQERRDTVQAFRRGDFKVLVNCGVFTEGTDIPNIDCVLLARPTRSRNLLIQMIGRGMRLHAEKTNCHIIDMVGSVEDGIVNTATLLGLDPDEVLAQDDLSSAQKRKAKQQESDAVKPARASITETRATNDDAEPPESLPSAIVRFTDYDSVFDLLSDPRPDIHIRRLSQLAWVFVSSSPLRYILSTRSGSIEIIANNSTPLSYTVKETRSLPPELRHGKHAFTKMKPRVIIDGVPTLEQAVRGADTYIAARYPIAMVSAHAKWRGEEASEVQMEFIRKTMGKQDVDIPTKKEQERRKREMEKKKKEEKKGPEAEEQEDNDAESTRSEAITRRWTKGEANDMITRLRHGGLKRWGELEKGRKKEKERAEKVEKLRRKEVVKVGKLE